MVDSRGSDSNQVNYVVDKKEPFVMLPLVERKIQSREFKKLMI